MNGIWESKCGHLFVGAGGINQKHGVGILLNKRWTQKITKTEHVSERVIIVLKLRHQRIVDDSDHFSHTGYADKHIEKMYKCLEAQCRKKHTTISAEDFNAQFGLGEGTESVNVGKYALGKSNKRGTWLKQWLVI